MEERKGVKGKDMEMGGGEEGRGEEEEGERGREGREGEEKGRG